MGKSYKLTEEQREEVFYYLKNRSFHSAINPLKQLEELPEDPNPPETDSSDLSTQGDR